jgi:hypothetical protein
VLFTLQETGEWMALLAPILNTLFDHKKSVGERGLSSRRYHREMMLSAPVATGEQQKGPVGSSDDGFHKP